MNKKIFYRILLLFFSCSIWFGTQKLIGKKDIPNKNIINDQIIGSSFITNANIWLKNNLLFLRWYIILSSLSIDLSVLYIFIIFIKYGKRSILECKIIKILIATLLCRQINQLITSLPKPIGKYWEYPGFPSLFVSYNVSNDMFFSGHTSISTIMAYYLWKKKLPSLSLIYFFLNTSMIIFTKGHYFMDIYTAIITSSYWILFFS